MANQATVNIPRDVLEPIIRQQVCAGITAALGDPAELIGKVVARALEVKVDRDGVMHEEAYRNTYPFIETICARTIHKITRDCIEEWVEAKRPEIKTAIEKRLARQTGPFAKALMDGMTEAIQQSWRFECKVMMARE